MLRQTLASLLIASLSFSAPPIPLVAAPRAQLPAHLSAVHCSVSDETHGRAVGQSMSTPVASVMVAPLPPPPPPPAPPVAIAESAGADIIVTSTIASPVRQSAANRPAPDAVERYSGQPIGANLSVATAPVSTFAVDVDTGAYANARRFLMAGDRPPPEAVRTEEMLNYFRYDYPRPTDRARPFSVTADAAVTPWNPATRLLRIGIRGYDVASDRRPPANLVFLVDVSGSMDEPDKLPLVKAALTDLADRLNPADRVSIVVYAGAAGRVLDPTSDKRAVKQALDCLDAGGSTAGGEGIALAYKTARQAFIPGGINRVILCTDGDFNVGTTDDKGLTALVRKQRDSGITLTTLGFGTGNYNDSMMETIADAGNGNYGYVDSAMEARKLLGEELSSTLFTIAQDVKVQLEFNPSAVREYRLIGYENRALREEDFANDLVDAGDIGAGHQVTALYEIVPANGRGALDQRHFATNRPAPSATGATDAAWLKLRYKLPGERQSRLIAQSVPAGLVSAAAAPTGDFAFAAAVAAFGQKLRGDPQLAQMGWPAIAALAQPPAAASASPWRQEFVALVALANKPAARSEDEPARAR